MRFLEMQWLLGLAGQEFTDFLVFWGVWQCVKVLESSFYPLLRGDYTDFTCYGCNCLLLGFIPNVRIVGIQYVAIVAKD